MGEMVERIGRAIAEADGEDYMEDWRRYDARARGALSAMDALASGRLPEEPTQDQRDNWEAKVSDLICEWLDADDEAVEPLCARIVDAIVGPGDIVKRYRKLHDVLAELRGES